jgi:hypothetical protein
MILLAYDGSADADAAVNRAVLAVPSRTLADFRRGIVDHEAVPA